jgi:hypothetical protein
MEKYLIILEDPLTEPRLFTDNRWKKAQELDHPCATSWDKVYLWEHPSSAIVRVKTRDRLAPVSVDFGGKVRNFLGRSLIEINSAGVSQPEANVEVHNIYIKLMNEMSGLRAIIYTEWNIIMD